jgi:hypothetical protein
MPARQFPSSPNLHRHLAKSVYLSQIFDLVLQNNQGKGISFLWFRYEFIVEILPTSWLVFNYFELFLWFNNILDLYLLTHGRKYGTATWINWLATVWISLRHPRHLVTSLSIAEVHNIDDKPQNFASQFVFYPTSLLLVGTLKGYNIGRAVTMIAWGWLSACVKSFNMVVNSRPPRVTSRWRPGYVLIVSVQNIILVPTAGYDLVRENCCSIKGSTGVCWTWRKGDSESEW